MRTGIAAVFMLLAAALGVNAQPVTIQVIAKGKILSMANPELRVKSEDIDIITKHAGDPRCVSTGLTKLSVDAGCVLDTSRTYTTSTTPQCASSYGQGGPGYGIVVSSCQSHDNTGSHWMSGDTLFSNIGVCRKKNTTQRGWYKAKHDLYMKCPRLEDWSQTYTYNYSASGTAWQYVQTLAPAPPAGVQNLTFSISVTPTNFVTQSGLFAGNPNVSGDKGLQLWIKPGNNNDLTVTALEVTQGIQNLRNEMPLVTRRRTMVRAYIRASLSNVNAVRATLAAYRNNVSLGTPVEAENTPAIRVTGGVRMTLDDAFWFQMPPAWRDQQGPVRFVVTVDPNNTVPEIDETNNTRDATVSFQNISETVITTVPFHMHVDGDKSKPELTYLQGDQTFWPIMGGMLRYLPAWALLVQDCGTTIQYPDFHFAGREWDMTKGATQFLILYRVARTRMLSGCGSHIQHWVGMIHPGVNTTTNSGTTLGIALPLRKSAWIRMDGNVDPQSPWRIRGSETAAHELAHNIGLPHVKCSGDEGFPSWDLYPHPAPNCRLATGDDGYYGLDVYYDRWGHAEPGVISNDPNAPAGKRAFPLMGYKNPAWADPFDYCLLLLNGGIFCNPLTMAKMGSPLLVRDEPIPVFPQRPQEYVTVGGVYDVQARQFAALDVSRTAAVSLNALARPANQQDPAQRRAPLVLLQVDATGTQLSSSDIETLGADGDPSFITFLETVPAAPGATGIQIRLGRTVLVHRQASANRPVVQLLEPNGGALKVPATIRWTATDADGDTLSVTVSYSPDGGRTWRPLATDVREQSLSLPAGTRLPGSSRGVLRIEANDGYHTAADLSDTPLSVSTAPPVPAIAQRDGLVIAQGRTLILDGSATDIDEGAITNPQSFRWFSDRDGAIGSGRELYIRNLTRGVHRITLQVRDAEGKEGRTSITVYVGVQPPITQPDTRPEA